MGMNTISRCDHDHLEEIGRRAYERQPSLLGCGNIHGPHSGLGTNEPIARPGFGTREADFPLMSRPETWLHRLHREGVPIVRLWNSKSALLSIGLNQKGKPGLWLIQKIH
jgi:hypothetical protein